MDEKKESEWNPKSSLLSCCLYQYNQQQLIKNEPALSFYRICNWSTTERGKNSDQIEKLHSISYPSISILTLIAKPLFLLQGEPRPSIRQRQSDKIFSIGRRLEQLETVMDYFTVGRLWQHRRQLHLEQTSSRRGFHKCWQQTLDMLIDE